MLPTRLRLPKEEFGSRGYKTIRTAGFLLKTKKNKVGYPRIGVVVGKPVYSKAVKRNFWKRRAKASLSKAATGGNDLLMIFLPGGAKLTKKKFQEDLSSALDAIK